jgi:TPR repeat protein
MGCALLSLSYETGKGSVKQDYSKAKEFYGKACDLKDQLSCEVYATLNK